MAGRIEHNLRTAARAGFGEEGAIGPALARFRVCETEAEALQGAEFVVEAVAEDLEVKRRLFSRDRAPRFQRRPSWPATPPVSPFPSLPEI